MATQTAVPANLTGENLQNPDSEPGQSAFVDQQNARVAAKSSSPTSVFVNSEPMREEQVQNAVKFLSHPKVRGSPVIYRRSFLEKKGLTKEEIDEAFRRVPDPSPTMETSGVNQDTQSQPSFTIQRTTPTQTLQPASAAPTGVISSLGTLTLYRFHWSHAIFAIGFFAVSGAGTALIIKNSIIPRLKSWIRKVVMEDLEPAKNFNLKPTLTEETATAAKAAAVAAADVAKVSQEILNSKLGERRHFQDFVKLLDVQVKEMKSMTNAIRRLEGKRYASGRTSVSELEDYRVTAASSKQSTANWGADYGLRPVKSAPPPTSVEPATAPHTKSYMDMMAMIRRGEKPSNIREINDATPNPNQQPSTPLPAPRAKFWASAQSQSNSIQVLQSQVNGQDSNLNLQENSYQLNNDNAVPWWEKKNVRITEIGNENELNAPSYVALSNDQPTRRAWVPPQPPPVVMAEAAEAIRRPKAMAQKQQSLEDKWITHSSDISDDLQRGTTTSESGSAIENNGVSSAASSGEIQKLSE